MIFGETDLRSSSFKFRDYGVVYVLMLDSPAANPPFWMVFDELYGAYFGDCKGARFGFKLNYCGLFIVLRFLSLGTTMPPLLFYEGCVCIRYPLSKGELSFFYSSPLSDLILSNDSCCNFIAFSMDFSYLFRPCEGDI